MRALEIVVLVELLDEFAETGVWCDRCLLPSRIRWPALLVSERTMHTLTRFHVTACAECGEIERER